MRQTIRRFISELNQFYPEYLKEHSDPVNQVLHFTGATAFFTLTILAFVLKIWWFIPLAVFIGYFLPGIGHRHFQHNKSFRSSKPVLCVICAFRLYVDTLGLKIVKKMKSLKTEAA